MKSIVYILFSIILVGCSVENEESTLQVKDMLTASQLDQIHKLQNVQIYFGHQSVGDDIVSGIERLQKEYPDIKINIERISKNIRPEGRAMFHEYIGENGMPMSKIESFKSAMQSGFGNTADIAIMKFCFWDIRGKADVDQIFSEYTNAIDQLKMQYPGIVFIHMTVPLMEKPKGFMNSVKRVLGVKVSGDLDNIKRNQLNSKIRRKYMNKEPIIDIAMFESITADGNRTTFSSEGMDYEYLNYDFTYDGGHLNEPGQLIIAKKFLLSLSAYIQQ